MRKPIILQDIDGCLLCWQSKLVEFLEYHNMDSTRARRLMYDDEYATPEEITGLSYKDSIKFIEEYNSSKWIKYLTPYRDALHIVNLLKEEYDFVAVTALGKNEQCVQYRMENLEFWYPKAFSSVRVVGVDESKVDILKEYSKTFFIDDSPNYCKEAKEVGHIAIRLMRDSRIDQINTIRCKDYYEIGSFIESNKWQIQYYE